MKSDSTRQVVQSQAPDEIKNFSYFMRVINYCMVHVPSLVCERRKKSNRVAIKRYRVARVDHASMYTVVKKLAGFRLRSQLLVSKTKLVAGSSWCLRHCAHAYRTLRYRTTWSKRDTLYIRLTV